MESLKKAAINKQAFIFSENTACMSITNKHTCLVVLLECLGSRHFKGSLTYYVVIKDIHRESDVILEASSNVGYSKAWRTDCRNDQ